MSSDFVKLMLIIVVVAIVGYSIIEVASFMNEAAEISSGTSDQF